MLHDTIEFDYHPDDMAAIGILHKNPVRRKGDGTPQHTIVCGLLMHSSLAVTTDGRRAEIMAYYATSEKGTHTYPFSASSRTRFRRNSVKLMASLRIIIRSCPFITKKDGAFPLVMASRAGALTSFRAIITPRVNVDLPSILPRKTRRSASGSGCFSHLDSKR